MFRHISEIVKHKAKRHCVRAVAFAVLGFISGAILASFVLYSPVYAPEIEEGLVSDVQESETHYARSAPTRLIIPKIELDTTFVEPLGLNEDRTVEVPDNYEQVGWYKNGATPGEVGSSVILGHVDSYEGPAIFYDLRELEEGDEVFIERLDGTAATFIVTGTETVSQDEFPTLAVYGPTEEPALRLVTCTGVYSHGTLRYSHNLIVYGKLKE